MNRSHLTVLPVLLADAASLHTVFLLFAYIREEPVTDQAGMLVWWGCLTATYVFLAWFLRRPRSLRGVAAVLGGGFFAQLAVTVLLGVRYPSVLSWVFLLLMWGGMYVHCYNALFHPFQTEQLVGAFERTVAALFLCALAVSGKVMTTASLLPPFIGVLLALLALSRSRSGHTRAAAREADGLPNRFLAALAVVLLGGGAALTAVFLTDTAAGFLTRFTSWLKAAATQALGALGRFFSWLVSLLPAPQGGTGELYAEEGVLAAAIEEAGTQSGFMLYLLVGIIVAVLLGLLIWFLRRGGIGRLPGLPRRTGTVRRTGKRLREILTQFLKRIAAFFHFQYAYLLRRNTAPGLLIWLERNMRRRRAGRKPGETARAFLIRIREEQLPQCGDALVQLADCLDAHYFGAGRDISHREAAALRRMLARELRQRGTRRSRGEQR